MSKRIQAGTEDESRSISSGYVMLCGTPKFTFCFAQAFLLHVRDVFSVLSQTLTHPGTLAVVSLNEAGGPTG